MEEVERVESYEALFAHKKKEGIFKIPCGGFGLAAEADRLNLLLVVRIGAQGGLIEHVVCLDPAMPILLDRLVFEQFSQSGDAIFLPLKAMRAEMKKKVNPTGTICIAALKTAQRELADPGTLRSKIAIAEAMRTTSSIDTISGGLPSLGKGAR